MQSISQKTSYVMNNKNKNMGYMDVEETKRRLLKTVTDITGQTSSHQNQRQTGGCKKKKHPPNIRNRLAGLPDKGHVPKLRMDTMFLVRSC